MLVTPGEYLILTDGALVGTERVRNSRFKDNGHAITLTSQAETHMMRIFVGVRCWYYNIVQINKTSTEHTVPCTALFDTYDMTL